MTDEPDIIINGVRLTSAQASSVRVAVTSMRLELQDEEHRAALGPIAVSYDARLSEVECIMQARGESHDRPQDPEIP